MKDRGISLRPGLDQSVLALVLAGAIAGIIVTTSWAQSPIGGRLALAGLVMFAAALGFGSSRFVGLATLPVLGGALLASAAAAEPAWVRSIVLGSLWYLTVEVAWDAIDRRDGAARSGAYDNRRVNEVATVVMLSLAVTTAGFFMSQRAPVRSLVVVGMIVVGLLLALNLATHLVGDGQPSVEEAPETANADAS